MGKIAKIIGDFLDNYDDVTAQFESETIKAENMKNRINAIIKQAEKEIIELIRREIIPTIKFGRNWNECRNRMLENLAKLKGD